MCLIAYVPFHLNGVREFFCVVSRQWAVRAVVVSRQCGIKVDIKKEVAIELQPLGLVAGARLELTTFGL